MAKQHELTLDQLKMQRDGMKRFFGLKPLNLSKKSETTKMVRGNMRTGSIDATTGIDRDSDSVTFDGN